MATIWIRALPLWGACAHLSACSEPDGAGAEDTSADGGTTGDGGDAGVGGDGGGDAGVAGDGGDGGDDPGPPYAVDTQDGFCDSTTGPIDTTGVELVFSGHGEGALFVQPTHVVETAEEWSAIVESTTFDAGPATVDFTTHRVMAAALWMSSTCGLSLDEAEVRRDTYGGPHLEVTIHDSSAGCADPCSATDGYAYVVAVPRELDELKGWATVCRRIEPGCA